MSAKSRSTNHNSKESNSQTRQTLSKKIRPRSSTRKVAMRSGKPYRSDFSGLRSEWSVSRTSNGRRSLPLTVFLKQPLPGHNGGLPGLEGHREPQPLVPTSRRRLFLQGDGSGRGRGHRRRRGRRSELRRGNGGSSRSGRRGGGGSPSGGIHGRRRGFLRHRKREREGRLGLGKRSKRRSAIGRMDRIRAEQTPEVLNSRPSAAREANPTLLPN